MPTRLLRATPTAVVLLLAALPAAAAPLLPDFASAVFRRNAIADNKYFPLLPGARNKIVARGEEDGEAFVERSIRTVLDRREKILGVRAQVLLDEEYVNGKIVEVTYDYFAQDTKKNVWYLGEDVTNYEYDDDGKLIGTNTDSTWRAGRNGAKAGWIMPGSRKIGLNYYQEYAPGEDALDHGTNFALIENLAIGKTNYANVLKVFETSEVEPEDREFKYYAPGIGLIRKEEDLDENLRNPEVIGNRVVPVPAPAALPLALAGCAALFGLRLRRRRGVATSPA